jgi:uncharacterized membrane protein
MFTNYQNPVYTLYNLFKITKVKSTLNGINNIIQQHPNYPSLLSITDTLSDYNVENAAIKIWEIEKLYVLPLPLISFINNDGGNFVIITKIIDNLITYNLNGIEKTVNIESFNIEWSKIVVIIETSNKSIEPNYKLTAKKEYWQKLKIPTILLWGILLIFLSRFRLNLNQLHYSLYIYTFLAFCGVFISSILLWYEVDKFNPALLKICTGTKKLNCNAILNSKGSKLFGIISWSEIGFIYFSFSYLLLILAGSKSIYFLAFLNLLALPYTIFSVYYQWQVAKHWCKLCLLVQIILIFQFISINTTNSIILESFNHILFSETYWESMLNNSLLISFTIPLSWYLIKPLLMIRYSNKKIIYELKRIKYNRNVFYELLHQQKKIDQPNQDLGITIGNDNAQNCIIKICNPYCTPCSKAHSRLENLLEQIPNLKVQIIFAVPKSILNVPHNPISHLMAIYSKKDLNLIRVALDDWYINSSKSYLLFAEKYKMFEELELQNENLIAMYNWCLDHNITYTPTIFFNNFQLPEAYDIEDLRHFIN